MTSEQSSERLSYSAIGRAIGKSGVHVARAFKGDPRVSTATLISIWRETGIKLGKIEGATDREIEIIARIELGETLPPKRKRRAA